MSQTKTKRSGGSATGELVAKALIVDDHELVRHGLAEMLDSQPDINVCGQAAGQQEAWELAQEMHPNLAIIDISLEEGNGIDLIKRLAQLDPSMRIVVLSSYNESLYAERSLRAGAQGYINKQTPSRQILTAIREVLSGNLYLSEQMIRQLAESAVGMRSPGVSPMATLSDRELEVFTLIGLGHAPGKIAEELHLSPRTVDTYRERLKDKLNLKSGSQLNRAAIEWTLENK